DDDLGPRERGVERARVAFEVDQHGPDARRQARLGAADEAAHLRALAREALRDGAPEVSRCSGDQYRHDARCFSGITIPGLDEAARSSSPARMRSMAETTRAPSSNEMGGGRSLRMLV